MPFNRTHPNGEPVIDRTQTGPPAPSPQTGTVRAEDGSIVADSATIEIPRATPVFVNQPSPFEPVIDAEGRITPRWWRFFDQLYRRTGGVVDNINRVPTVLLGAGGSVAMVIAGKVPLVSKLLSLGAPASMALAGAAPTIMNGFRTALGSMSIAGSAPTVLIDKTLLPTIGSMAVAGKLPVRILNHITTPSTGSMSISGQTPEAFYMRFLPTLGSMAITGAAPTVSILISVPTGSMTLTGELPIRVP